MRRCILIITGVLLSVSTSLFSQSEKKTLEISDLIEWKNIDNKKISNDGELVSYEVKPFKGDGTLYLWNSNTNSE
ncbi:MAG: hypothetical protein ACLFT4_03865, partial [Bacteroidales bacterium]